jgi:hypothetical protein
MLRCLKYPMGRVNPDGAAVALVLSVLSTPHGKRKSAAAGLSTPQIGVGRLVLFLLPMGSVNRKDAPLKLRPWLFLLPMGSVNHLYATWQAMPLRPFYSPWEA